MSRWVAVALAVIVPMTPTEAALERGGVSAVPAASGVAPEDCSEDVAQVDETGLRRLTTAADAVIAGDQAGLAALAAWSVIHGADRATMNAYVRALGADGVARVLTAASRNIDGSLDDVGTVVDALRRSLCSADGQFATELVNLLFDADVDDAAAATIFWYLADGAVPPSLLRAGLEHQLRSEAGGENPLSMAQLASGSSRAPWWSTFAAGWQRDPVAALLTRLAGHPDELVRFSAQPDMLRAAVTDHQFADGYEALFSSFAAVTPLVTDQTFDEFVTALGDRAGLEPSDVTSAASAAAADIVRRRAPALRSTIEQLFVDGAVASEVVREELAPLSGDGINVSDALASPQSRGVTMLLSVASRSPHGAEVVECTRRQMTRQQAVELAGRFDSGELTSGDVTHHVMRVAAVDGFIGRVIAAQTRDRDGTVDEASRYFADRERLTVTIAVEFAAAGVIGDFPATVAEYESMNVRDQGAAVADLSEPLRGLVTNVGWALDEVYGEAAESERLPAAPPPAC